MRRAVSTTDAPGCRPFAFLIYPMPKPSYPKFSFPQFFVLLLLFGLTLIASVRAPVLGVVVD